MTAREILSTVLNEFHEKLKRMSDGVAREISVTEMPHKIRVIMGMRRTGKTYFLYQQIKNLLRQKVPLSRFLIINFEDDRLLPVTQQKFSDLVDSFYEIYPENHEQKCYLIFDEIQNVEDWPVVVRRLLDSKNAEIFLSGSSAKLLSKEIATSLRGRSLATEIWPYSFSEYLAAKHIVLEKKLRKSKKAMDVKGALLHTYLLKGGFPETIIANEVEHRDLLQEYVDVVVYRDIIERHKITNISLIKYLIKTLLKNVGSIFSVNKFHKNIKSQGLPSGKNTVYDYLEYIEDAYIAFKVPLYSESLRKVQSNPKKIYAVDTGLVHAYTFSLNHNIGHLFENLIYLDLRRQGGEIYYYLTEERYEIDFLVRTPQGVLKLLQVVYDPSDKKTLEREMRALEKAEQELGIKGELITADSYLENI
ncbi:MAG: ATP-binding protein [Gammaproteobacteria bacterium]|nr:ATP-binding protein [Gammaproteobacteria bacterium]